MLGKGLESLIPKKSVSDEQSTGQNEPAIFEPQSQPANQKDLEENFSSPKPTQMHPQPQKEERDFSYPKPAQASGHGVPRSGTSEPRNKRASTLGERSGLREGKSLSENAIFHIEVEKIKSNPLQPRKEFNEEALKDLASSIREFGILQPIVVSKIEIEKEFGSDVEYQLIAGERRLMAAKLLGWERVPAIIRKTESKANQLELAIIENLQRENLNSIETARAYAKLQDEFGLTQREVATRLGKSRETIANALRLLSLPTEIQDAISKGQINESQARLLLTIADQGQQQKLFQELISKNLSVRALRQKLNRGGQAENAKQQTVDPEILRLEEKLTELLGAKVKIDPPSANSEEKNQRGGKIIISFYSPEEIQGIIDKLTE